MEGRERERERGRIGEGKEDLEILGILSPRERREHRERGRAWTVR